MLLAKSVTIMKGLQQFIAGVEINCYVVPSKEGLVCGTDLDWSQAIDLGRITLELDASYILKIAKGSSKSVTLPKGFFTVIVIFKQTGEQVTLSQFKIDTRDTLAIF